jgi:type I restriction enzyme S subunit
MEKLLALKIAVPPLATQHRIADILSTYDDLIENNLRRLALLEQAARLLYEEWFVRLKFPGHERTRFVDGVPEGWGRKRLDDVAAVNERTLPGSYQGEIEYVDIASVTPGAINETTIYDFQDAPSRARRIVRHGDIIWSCVRPNRRSHAIAWHPSDKLVASTGFAVLTPKGISAAYLYFAVTTTAFVAYLENRARGVAYPAVLSGDFESAPVLIPSRALVSSFNEFAEPILDQTQNLRGQNQKRRVARDLLLPRLMSGEVAV